MQIYYIIQVPSSLRVRGSPLTKTSIKMEVKRKEKTMRKWAYGIALFVVAVVVAVACSTTPTVSSQNGRPTPVGTRVPVGGTRAEVPQRFLILSQKLGIPVETLKTKSPAEIQKLFEDNANKIGINTYRLVKDAEGKENFVKTGGTKMFPNPSNPVPPVAPQPAPLPKKEYKAPTGTFFVYLPLIVKSQNDPVLEADLKTRIDKAAYYVFWLTETDAQSPYAFVKEYPACPLGILNRFQPNDYRSTRFVGDYYQSKSQALGKVTWYGVGYDYDISDVDFEEYYNWGYGEPKVTCDRIYGVNVNGTPSPGATVYEVTKLAWTGDTNDWEDVFIADTLMLEDVWNLQSGTLARLALGPEARLPSHRYTIRHASYLGQLFYGSYPQYSNIADKLRLLGNDFGFLADVYIPMWEGGVGLADDYMFQWASYRDCDLANNGIDSTLPFGFRPHRYPYESKVCINRDAYITLSRADRLAQALQAIHILNKYHNPDRQYPHPVSGFTTTPRQIARDLENGAWNGYGINAYLKDPAYASGVRTNAFLVLETLLGYKYGDQTSSTFADNTVAVLREVQWGMLPYPPYHGETADDGTILRPIHTGGELLSWRTGGSYIFGLPPRSFINDLLDFLGMPKETEGPVPSNAETTITYWQALRIYLKYKYNVAYP